MGRVNEKSKNKSKNRGIDSLGFKMIFTDISIVLSGRRKGTRGKEWAGEKK